MAAKTRLVVTDSPWNAVGDGVTSDTAAINACIASLKSAGLGGDVIFPALPFLASVNRANCDGINLIGEGQAINSGCGARIIPDPTYGIGIDLSGSSGTVKNLQVGSQRGGALNTVAQIGILMAQTTDRPGCCTLADFDQVFIDGTSTGFGLLGIGIVDWTARNSRFWNYAGYNAPVCFTAENIWGFTSPWSHPIAPGTVMGSGNLDFDKCEFHDFIPSGRSNGSALILLGAAVTRLKNGCMIDSSSSGGAIAMYNMPSSCKLDIDGTFSSQNGNAANYEYVADGGPHYVHEQFDIATWGQQYVVGKASGGISFV